MNISAKYLKVMPLLLVIGLIVFIKNDQTEFRLKQTVQPISPKGTDKDPVHDHGEKDIDHLDPEAQKRMGIYHYNEGNNFLKQNNLEEAISNYKMALHHNKNFEEAYINLSTAYLGKKQFKSSLKTLNTLESINPRHPLLHYNFACYYALLGNITMGIESLKQAISNGFKNHRILKTDPDIESLRQDPQFKELQTLLLARDT